MDSDDSKANGADIHKATWHALYASAACDDIDRKTTEYRTAIIAINAVCDLMKLREDITSETTIGDMVKMTIAHLSDAMGFQG